jgi:hypothetical protein
MKPSWKSTIIGAAVPLLLEAGFAVAPIAVADPDTTRCGGFAEISCNAPAAPPGPREYCKRVGNGSHCGPDVLPGCLETGGAQPCDPDPSAP